MPVKTWVGRFAMVQGRPQEEGPFLRSFLRQRPDEEEDELYVLVEPASSGSAEYCGQLVDAIGRMYRQDTLSLTGAVARALRGANQQLRDWNERSLRDHQVGAGVSCLAVRGRTAYLAQIGPSAAYQVQDGRFQPVVPEDGVREPLGQAEQVEPVFNRYQLSPGDLILVASSRIQQILDEQALRSVLLQGADEALAELYRLARDQQEFSLLLLACVVEPETEAAPAEEPPPTEGPPAGAEEARAGEEPELAAPEPTAELAAATAPAGLSQPRVRLKGAEAAIRYARTTGFRAGVPRVSPLAPLAILILVLVGLLAWCLVPSALEESRDDRYAGLVAEARVALANAQETDDPGQRRESLRATDLALAEAEDLNPDDAAVAELRGQVAALVAELDAVLELPELDFIVDVSERVPGAVSARDLALGGGGAYFLDRQGQRVIVISLLGPNPEPQALFQAGDLAGTEIAGAPQHIAWAPELGALLILDDARRLIAARFGEAPQPLTLRDAQAWGSADGIAYVGGSLYLLDREGDQVWRYLPTETGFDSEREPLLASVELEHALEVAVSDALYLVLEDGTILRFQGPLVQTLSQAGIDLPLLSPASLVPLPASDRLFVADRGNKRIVVLSPDGTFRQQLRSPTFTDLRSIAVDEPNGLLYILVGGALYRTPLPPSP